LKRKTVKVRFREGKIQREMPVEELVKEVKDKTNGYPWRPLPLPKELSRRPTF
jgi:threonyl-tRNA synthetase